MRKTLLLLILISVCVFLCCMLAGAEEENYDLIVRENQHALNGDVTYIVDSMYRNGKLCRTEKYSTYVDVLDTWITYEYDDLGRLTEERSRGKRKSIITYTYDGNSDRIAVKEGSAKTVYEYDDHGQLIMEEYEMKPSVSDGANDYIYEYIWEQDKLIRRIEHKKGSAGSGRGKSGKLVYKYDDNGNMTISAITEYSYDENDYLIFEEKRTGTGTDIDRAWRYIYNEQGQRIEADYLYKPETLEDTPSSVIRYTYDDRGNLLLSETIPDSGKPQYEEKEYDEDNRVVSYKKWTEGKNERNADNFWYTYEYIPQE